MPKKLLAILGLLLPVAALGALERGSLFPKCPDARQTPQLTQLAAAQDQQAPRVYQVWCGGIF